ncbi:MAG TPA: radical SAM protein [Candidatus Omnitrophota bacterium]|nr:radical SAM protein [Candidatus Omnitrophota bacterium]
MFDRVIRGVCPVCDKIIPGKVIEKDGAVLLQKICPEHGTIIDKLSSEPALFRDRMSLLDHMYPNKCSSEKCKHGIFKCKEHVGRKSPLAFIEITTRCNMLCPVCYADAAAKGKDMPLEDVNRILDTIAKEDKNTHVILIGGEPTIHKDFFRILDRLRENGLMKRAFIATNCITTANKEFSKRIHDAGIKKFYLAFDGTDREACKNIRGSYVAYDSLRKALQNIRENGKAWIILSFTAVRGVNLDNIHPAIDFAMDNGDIVKRLMISPEVFCGRVTEKKNLADERLTGDCVEMYIRKSLGVKVATVSLSLFYALLNPLKNMRLLDVESWMGAAPSPFCGQMGLIWKDKDGKYHSIVDLLVKDSDKNIYELGRRANALADNILSVRKKFSNNFFMRVLWQVFACLYFLPRYIFLMLSFLNWNGLSSMLKVFWESGFNVKKFKKSFFHKRVELYFLLGTDKYNFIWDKMPYCLTHHYRIDSDTNEVMKVPGCFVFPFRSELE